MLVINLHPSLQFTDLSIDAEQNLFVDIENLNYKNSKPILNSNRSHTMSAYLDYRTFPTCELNVTFGWELWDYEDSQKIDSSYENLTSFPKYSYYASFTVILPEINLSSQGQFTLKYGFFSSSGNPYSDIISNNNIASIEIIVDDTIDLALISMEPRNTGVTNEYIYGTNMVDVSVANIGNVTVENVSVNLEVLDYNGISIYSSICIIDFMAPNDLFLLPIRFVNPRYFVNNPFNIDFKL